MIMPTPSRGAGASGILRPLALGFSCLSRHPPPRPGYRLFSATTPRCHSPGAVPNEKLAALARCTQHRLGLADLVKHGRPPLSEAALLSSANFTLSLLPIRLAKRIWAFRSLPYFVVDNPSINQIYGNYQKSLSTLLPWLEPPGSTAATATRTPPRIATLADETRFTETLAELVATHANTIPILAKGFLECRRYVDPDQVTAFLNEHLHARIGTRLIAEQHISLHNASRPHLAHGPAQPGGAHHHQDPLAPPPEDLPDGSGNSDGNWIGVIDTALKPVRTVEMCAGFATELAELRYGVRPEFEINGELDTTFAFVPMHLEYILTELLKNAFRATVESGRSHEPVIVTIGPEPPTPESQRVGGLHATARANKDGILPLDDNAPGVTIRIRDRGGGIPADVLPNVWRYSFTTVPEDEHAGLFSGAGGGGSVLSALANATAGGSSMAGLGYGLPLGRAYAEYFGGGVKLQSLPGWGTDVYLRLKGVGRVE